MSFYSSTFFSLDFTLSRKDNTSSFGSLFTKVKPIGSKSIAKVEADTFAKAPGIATFTKVNLACDQTLGTITAIEISAKGVEPRVRYNSFPRLQHLPSQLGNAGSNW